MDKIIPFNKGIRRQPSLGDAGELSECVNLIPQNGELVNVRGLKKVMDSINGDLLCVHKVFDAISYICKDSDKQLHVVSVKYDNSDEKEQYITVDSKIIKAIAIGNIVCLVCEDGLYYLYWKEGLYENLGMNIPHPEASFYTKYKKKTDYGYCTVDVNDPSESLKTKAAPRYLADLNEYSKSYFINPFFVKCCYKLYDNTYMDCSPQVLMACTTKFPMMAELKAVSSTEGNLQMKYTLYWHRLFVSSSQSESVKNSIEKFGDLIKSVCIFISPLQLGGTECHSTWTNNMIDNSTINGYDVEKGTFSSSTLSKPSETGSAVFINRNFHNEVEECSSFYFLKEIPLSVYLSGEDIALNGNEDFTLEELGEFEDLDLRQSAIVTREYLNTNFVNSRTTASSVFSYNNRLIMGNLKRWLYGDVSSFSFFAYYPYSTNNTENDAYVVIEKDGLEYVIELPDANYAKTKFNLNNSYYFFYPDEYAKKLLLPVPGMPTLWYPVELTRHPTLKGSYAYNEMGKISGTSTGSDYVGMKTDNWYSSTRDVCFTNANNPLLFGDINYISVGNGEVIGLSTSAKALSQGQFGQFPLYVFCTDGIWALEVADDGTFKSTQPISRDVCNNPDSVTQIDGAVVFTTDQGLKLIQGSEVALLSGHLEGHNVDESLYFKQHTDGMGFFEKYGMKEFDKLVNPERRDIRDILRTCRIAYDYTNQLLRIFPKREEGVAETPYKYYVYSFTTQEFSTVIGNEFDNGDGTFNEVTTVVPDYPSSVIQIGGSLYRPMETEREGFHEGLLLTRPLLFDEPFALKKLQDMRLQYSKFYKDNEGNSSKCHVIVYVSNDGKNWAMLKSLRGGSFKYFRIAVVTKLSDADALTGVIARYELNRINKLR